MHLLSKLLWNSFLLYKNVVGNGTTFLEFRIQVVEELLHKYDSAVSGQKNLSRSPTIDNSAQNDTLYPIFLLLLQNMSLQDSAKFVV